MLCGASLPAYITYIRNMQAVDRGVLVWLDCSMLLALWWVHGLIKRKKLHALDHIDV